MQEDTCLEQTLTINGTEYYLHREKPTDSTWWAEPLKDGELDQSAGEQLFTLDLKRIYSLFIDYPSSLTTAEKEIFDRENPFWKEFFADRQ